MTTSLEKKVTRKTVGKYTVSVSSARQSESGRHLIVSLSGDQFGDWIEIREQGKRKSIALSIPGIYHRALVTNAGIRAKQKGVR